MSNANPLVVRLINADDPRYRVCPLQLFGLFDIVWSSVLLLSCTVELKTQAAQSMPFALKIHWLVRSIVEEWLGFDIWWYLQSQKQGMTYRFPIFFHHFSHEKTCGGPCSLAGQDARAVWKCHGDAQPLRSCDGVIPRYDKYARAKLWHSGPFSFSMRG